jgi:hypothetical protein
MDGADGTAWPARRFPILALRLALSERGRLT